MALYGIGSVPPEFWLENMLKTGLPPEDVAGAMKGFWTEKAIDPYIPPQRGGWREMLRTGLAGGGDALTAYANRMMGLYPQARYLPQLMQRRSAERERLAKTRQTQAAAQAQRYEQRAEEEAEKEEETQRGIDETQERNRQRREAFEESRRGAITGWISVFGPDRPIPDMRTPEDVARVMGIIEQERGRQEHERSMEQREASKRKPEEKPPEPTSRDRDRFNSLMAEWVEVIESPEMLSQVARGEVGMDALMDRFKNQMKMLERSGLQEIFRSWFVERVLPVLRPPARTPGAMMGY